MRLAFQAIYQNIEHHFKHFIYLTEFEHFYHYRVEIALYKLGYEFLLIRGHDDLIILMFQHQIFINLHNLHFLVITVHQLD